MRYGIIKSTYLQKDRRKYEMSNCGCKRDTDPAGIWDYLNFIGAKAKIKSVPISNFSNKLPVGECTILDVYFRVSLDGKAITVVRLKECPDLFFTLKDLEIIETKNYPQSMCGGFKVGSGVVGYGDVLEEDLEDLNNFNYGEED